MGLMNDKEKNAFDALPKPEQGLAFRLGRVTTMYDPHPGPEKHGAKCPTKGCTLKYADHKSQLLAVIVLDTKDPMRCDLDKMEGLEAYLKSVKQAAGLGIEGFLFPSEAQEAKRAKKN